MLVRLDGLDGYVHGPAKGYASGEVEIALLDAKLQPAVRGGRIFHIDAPQQAALRYLSNLLGAELPAVNWGDRVFSANEGRAPLIGVLDYNFGKYQFLPLPGANLRVERGALPGENATAASPSDFTVCTFNLHGLGRGAEQHPDPADYDAALARRARIIAGTLAGCTLIGLQETGAPADAEALARRLVEEYDLPYIAVALPGPGTFDPDFPLTNGFLLRSDRATALAVDSPQTCTAQDYDVPLTGGNSCPPGQFPLFDRPPLVLDAAVSGAWGEDFVLRVVNNHWKSKAGDESVNAPRRLEQARSIAAIVQERLDDDPAAHVIVLGDLNDFYDGPALELLTAAPLGLVNTLSYLAPSDRYTYIYNGASQALDHILISPNMVQLLSRVDAVHNSADRASGGAGQDDDAQAVSDHDPVVVQFRPEGAATIAGNAGFAGIVVGLEREGRPMQFVAVSDRRGDFRIWDSTPGTVTLHYWPPAWLEVDEPSVQLQFGPRHDARSVARHRSAWLAARALLFHPSSPHKSLTEAGAIDLVAARGAEERRETHLPHVVRTGRTGQRWSSSSTRPMTSFLPSPAGIIPGGMIAEALKMKNMLTAPCSSRMTSRSAPSLVTALLAVPLRLAARRPQDSGDRQSLVSGPHHHGRQRPHRDRRGFPNWPCCTGKEQQLLPGRPA